MRELTQTQKDLGSWLALHYRVPLAAVLFFLEFFWFSGSFDVGTFPAAGPVGEVIRNLGTLASGVLVFFFVVALFVIADAKHVLRWALQWHDSARHSVVPSLAVHSIAFVAFVAVTHQIYAQTLEGSAVSLVWLALAALTAISLLTMIGPVASWVAITAQYKWQLLVALVASCACVAAGGLTQSTWYAMAGGTFVVVRFLLAQIYSDVQADTEARTLWIDDFDIRIAAECSGYEGIGLTLGFLVSFFVIFHARLRFPHCLLLLPLGAALIWLFNSLRIAALVVVGVSYSPELAFGGFHSKAGWLGFNCVALGIAYASLQMPFFAKGLKQPEAAPTTVGRAAMTKAYVMPLMFVVGGLFLTDMLAVGFDWLYIARTLVTAAVLVWYVRAYRSDSWTGEGVGLAILNGTVVFLLWWALEPTPEAKDTVMPPALAQATPFARWAWLFFRVIGSVLVIPLAEELAFRGYLLRRVVNVRFREVPLGYVPWLGLLISSVAFGALHGRWLAGTFAGLLYGLAYCRKGNLAEPVIAHMVSNALIAACVLAAGMWHFW